MPTKSGGGEGVRWREGQGCCGGDGEEVRNRAAGQAFARHRPYGWSHLSHPSLFNTCHASKQYYIRSGFCGHGHVAATSFTRPWPNLKRFNSIILWFSQSRGVWKLIVGDFFYFFFLLQVAEYGEERRVVGVVRGCVKTVTRGKSMYVKVAYILGLRVCPAHRSHSLSRFPESHSLVWLPLLFIKKSGPQTWNSPGVESFWWVDMRGSIPVNASTAPNKLQSTNGEYMYYMYVSLLHSTHESSNQYSLIKLFH